MKPLILAVWGNPMPMFTFAVLPFALYLFRFNFDDHQFPEEERPFKETVCIAFMYNRLIVKGWSAYWTCLWDIYQTSMEKCWGWATSQTSIVFRYPLCELIEPEHLFLGAFAKYCTFPFRVCLNNANSRRRNDTNAGYPYVQADALQVPLVEQNHSHYKSLAALGVTTNWRGKLVVPAGVLDNHGCISGGTYR